MLKGVRLPRLFKVIGETAADLVREKCSSGIPVTLSKAIFAPHPPHSRLERKTGPDRLAATLTGACHPEKCFPGVSPENKRLSPTQAKPLILVVSRAGFEPATH